jgi:hypothetical protein
MHDGAGPADGIAFVLRGPSSGQLGADGGGLGYSGLSPSVAVEFDIYQNAGEPDANEVEVTRTDAGGQASLVTRNPGFPLYGQPLYVWVDYAAGAHRLDVYVSPTTDRPAQPTTSAQVDLGGLLGAGAVAGFTAGTGGATAQQDVRSWTLTDATLPQS